MVLGKFDPGKIRFTEVGLGDETHPHLEILEEFTQEVPLELSAESVGVDTHNIEDHACAQNLVSRVEFRNARFPDFRVKSSVFAMSWRPTAWRDIQNTTTRNQKMGQGLKKGGGALLLHGEVYKPPSPSGPRAHSRFLSRYGLLCRATHMPCQPCVRGKQKVAGIRLINPYLPDCPVRAGTPQGGVGPLLEVIYTSGGGWVARFGWAG